MQKKRVTILTILELREILAKHFAKKYSGKNHVEKMLKGEISLPHVWAMDSNKLISTAMDEDISWGKMRSEEILVYHEGKDCYFSLWNPSKVHKLKHTKETLPMFGTNG